MPLDRSVILLQELLQGMRKLVSFGRNLYVSVDCFPTKVLQGAQVTGERSDELQGDLLTSRENVIHIPTASVPFALRHIVMDQFEDAVKMGNGLNVLRVCLQVKRSCITLNAQIFGARRCLDTEGEQMSIVRAVPHQEGARALGCQHSIGILSCDGPPVEATLLELVESGEDHLVLCLGGESLVTLRQPHFGIHEAAAHCGIKLAVSYHGAVPNV